MQKVVRPIKYPGRLCRLKQDSLKLTIGDPRQTMARASVHNPVTRRDLISELYYYRSSLSLEPFEKQTTVW